MSAVVRHMLDTNVFNAMLDEKILLSCLRGCRLLATSIQRDELNNTKDPERRTKLLAMFEEINPEVGLASSFAFDIEGAGLDQACWNDGSGNFERMLVRLQELDHSKKREKDQRNQNRDILIAETAIKCDATLVTNDCNLLKVVTEFGGRAINSTKLTAACP